MTRLKALGLSLALHIGAALLICLTGIEWFQEPLPQSPISVSLSKLGVKRDQTLLPRIDASMPPKQRSPVPVKSKTSNPLDILKKRFGKPDLSGNEHGSKYGDSISSELADSYEQQVATILRENYEIPRVITHSEAKQLKLWVRLWIAADGKPMKITIQKPSKNKRFDDAVLTGSKRIDSFGPPPLTMSKKYRREGLLIQFCPLECT